MIVFVPTDIREESIYVVLLLARVAALTVASPQPHRRRAIETGTCVTLSDVSARRATLLASDV
jgi:hypothetical protein